MTTYDPEYAAEVAFDEARSSRADPDCCEICGGWLKDEKRWPTGRAHYDCANEVMFESMGGYDMEQLS